MLEEIKQLVFNCCGDQTWFPHTPHSTELFEKMNLDFIILNCFYMQVKWSGVHFVAFLLYVSLWTNIDKMKHLKLSAEKSQIKKNAETKASKKTLQ